MMRNPIQAFLDIRKGERIFSVSMFAYFFLVITSFWILKPVKKTLFIRHYDEAGFRLLDWSMSAAQAELLAKVLNMFVAIAAAAAFAWLAGRLRRSGLACAFGGFFLLCFALLSTLLESPGSLTVWAFYLFGDLYSTVMVATFFAFLNDSVDPRAAKRLYGLIGLGGVLGGVFGSSVVRAYIKSMEAADWQWVCFGLGLLILGAAVLAGRTLPASSARESGRSPVPGGGSPSRGGEGASNSGGSLLEGAALALKSPYLLSLAAMVGLYEIVSTLIDFQFTAAVAHYKDGEAIGRHFSTVYSVTNWLSMGVQFLLTSLVMSHLGVGAALLALPLFVLGGSAGFLVLPVLWMGSALSIGDNALNYSINQSARESLYTAATRDEKYKAKAFIDMFVQRFAKALAVGVSLLVTAFFADFSAIRWLSLASISLGLVWLLAARHAGRRFAELAEAGPALAVEGREMTSTAGASGRTEARAAEADARRG